MELPKIMKLEHIGIAVADIEKAVAVYTRILECKPYKHERVESELVETHFLWADGVKIELLAAASDDSVISRFIEKRGEGLHHIAFNVDNLGETAERLEAAGFELIGADSPGLPGENRGPIGKEGADNKRIFFLHPRDTNGVLIECCASVQSGMTARETVTVPDGEIRGYGHVGNPPLLLVTLGVSGSEVLDPEEIIARLEPVLNIYHIHLMDDDLDINTLMHNDIFPSHFPQGAMLLTLGISSFDLGNRIVQSTDFETLSWIHVDPHRPAPPVSSSPDCPCLFITSKLQDHGSDWPVSVLLAAAMTPENPSRDALIPLFKAFWSQ